MPMTTAQQIATQTRRPIAAKQLADSMADEYATIIEWTFSDGSVLRLVNERFEAKALEPVDLP